MIGGRAVGLEVDDEDPVGRQRQTVDPARHLQSAHPRRQRHLGARAGGEDVGKAGVVQHPHGGRDHLGATGVVQIGLAGQQPRRGRRPGFRRDVGQALQQPVDQVTAPEPAQGRPGPRRRGQGRRCGRADRPLRPRGRGRPRRAVGRRGPVDPVRQDGRRGRSVDGPGPRPDRVRPETQGPAVQLAHTVQPGEGLGDRLIPAAGRGLPVRRDPTHDHDPVARPGQGDIEQAQALGRRARLAPGPGRGRDGTVLALRRGTQHPALRPVRQVHGQQQGPAPPGRHARGVGQDHDRRLQPLGPVHGHDPHLAARALQLALDLHLGGLHPRKRRLQIDRTAPLAGQHQIQGLVDRLGRLGAQPVQHPHPSGQTPRIDPVQQAGEEAEGVAVGQPQRRVQQVPGLAPDRPFPGPRPQLRPQARPGRLRPGEVEQAVLVHVAEGAAQDFGHGQVVVGEQGEAGQGAQVVEGRMLRQLQPVGPRHRHARRLQPAQDLLEQGVALAHQHQEVAVTAGPPGPFLVEHGHAGLDLTPDLAGQITGQPLARPVPARGVQRRVPGLDGNRGVLLMQGQQIDAAGLIPSRGDVIGPVARLANGGQGPLRPGEGRVDEPEDVRRRPERRRQVHAQEGLPRVLDEGQIVAALLPQPLRPGTLEGIDRLFLVAHGEDGARTGPIAVGPRPGKKTLGQGAQDVPLLGGRVLGLVQQDMVDAAVQLEQHPGGVGAAGQQLHRPVDQIREVQPAGRRLGRVVEGGVDPGQGQHMFRLLGGAQLPRLVQPGEEGSLKGLELGPGGGRGLFARHGLARLAVGQKDRPQPLEAPFGRAHPLRALAVFDSSGGDLVGERQPSRPIQPAHEARLMRLQRPVRGPDQVARRGRGPGGDPLQPVGQDPPLGLDPPQQVVEGLPVQGDGEMGIGPAHGVVRMGQGVARQLLARGKGQFGRGDVVQHLKARIDAGLHRKAPQQLFAEGMQGLDLQPARRLQRAGEQAARARQVVGSEGVGGRGVKLRKGAGQLRIVHHRPFAKAGKQPALHLRGGGLGVGDAQDLGRLRALQQQPRHPVDQGRGLARAGIGHDEDRGPGVGRPPLVRIGPGAGSRGTAHASSPSPPPETCHSQTRASWS